MPSRGPGGPSAGEVPQASGNHHPAIAPYGLFRAADGMIQAAVGNDQQWRRFAGCSAWTRRPASPRPGHASTTAPSWSPRSRTTRRRHRPTPGWPASPGGVPAGRIRTLDEVYTWDQTFTQGLLIDVDHPTLGPVQLPGPPLRFETTPTGAGRATPPPPLLGEHDAAVRAWLDALDAKD